jgi:hypothetical protein
VHVEEALVALERFAPEEVFAPPIDVAVEARLFARLVAITKDDDVITIGDRPVVHDRRDLGGGKRRRRALRHLLAQFAHRDAPERPRAQTVPQIDAQLRDARAHVRDLDQHVDIRHVHMIAVDERLPLAMVAVEVEVSELERHSMHEPPVRSEQVDTPARPLLAPRLQVGPRPRDRLAHAQLIHVAG